jgi:hypothetical protein
MCFTIDKRMKGTGITTVYKVLEMQKDGSLLGPYYNMRFRLGRTKRIRASQPRYADTRRSHHGLYVFRHLAEARGVWTAADKRIVRCEVKEADFLFAGKAWGRTEMTYRAIKPVEVLT